MYYLTFMTIEIYILYYVMHLASMLTGPIPAGIGNKLFRTLTM